MRRRVTEVINNKALRRYQRKELYLVHIESHILIVRNYDPGHFVFFPVAFVVPPALVENVWFAVDTPKVQPDMTSGASEGYPGGHTGEKAVFFGDIPDVTDIRRMFETSLLVRPVTRQLDTEARDHNVS